jgi:carbonic anhydrase/acetyltransferase-like protein (isoleucine patch superfamily)
MNSIILPGVVLGIRTIVGAGSVVTKSFPDGYCVIAGNPAKIIKTLDKEKFVKHQFKEEYYGYVPKKKFEEFRKRNLQKIKFDFDVSKVTENPFYNNEQNN